MTKDIMYDRAVAEIKGRLWESLNLIRGSVQLSDFHLVLYLLTLYRMGLLEKTRAFELDQLKEALHKVISQYDGHNAESLREIHVYFQESIYEIPDDALADLIQVIDSIDQKILDENFPEIFDDFLYKLYKSLGKLGGESILPKEITAFICELADLQQHGSVYNPFAGVASFAAYLDSNLFYFGQEISYPTWTIGQLRIMAYKKQERAFLAVENSIENWGYRKFYSHIPATPEELERIKFDLVIAEPPFNMRLPQVISGMFGTIKTAEHFLIEKSIDELNSKGKLVAVISHGFLFRGGSEKELRQYLIENDLVDTIISMPGGLLMNTTIPFSVLVLNKAKSKKGIVRLIDAGDFTKDISRREKILLDKELIETINNRDQDKAIRYISNAAIAENEFNLSVARYFNRSIDGVYLREILQQVRGPKAQGIMNGKVIKVADLKDDKFNYRLEISLNDESQIVSTEQMITQSCLLVALAGEKLKPTYFNFTGTPVYISTNVNAFKVDQTKIDLDFLLAQLYTTTTLEQINGFLVGSGIRRIRKEDFLNIRIEIPSLSEQRARVKMLKEEHFKNREYELRLEREILGLKDEAYREFASIKHTFRQYLNALKSNVSGTKKFLRNKESLNISLDTIYSTNLNRTLGEHLMGLEGTIDSMSRLLFSFEDQPEQQERGEWDLSKLVTEAQDRFKNPEAFIFEKLFVDIDSFDEIEGDGETIAPMVHIHPDDFFRVFSNIVSNAVEHGFKGKKQNIIRTSLSFDAVNLFCILEISNNGWPIPDGFTQDHITTRGEKTSDSAGSGVGGADIKSIVDKYDGSLEIKNDKIAEFPVTYIIGLPLVVYKL